MRLTWLTWIAYLILAFPASAQEQIPQEVLNRIKEATVFIKVTTPSGEGSGSGFLVEPEHDHPLVITNHHVVVHARPSPGVGQLSKCTTVRQRSGYGTPGNPIG